MSCHLQHPQVSLKIPKSTEQLQLGIFVPLCQKFSYRKNKLNIRHDTKKHPPGAIHFSAGRKGEKHTPAEFIFFSMHRCYLWLWQNTSTMLSSGVCQDKTRFWCLGSRRTGVGAEFLVTGRAVWVFALAKFPFIYVNLQPFSSVQGHPLESLLQRKSVQTLMKTVLLPPSPNFLWVYGPEEKCSHPPKWWEEIHPPKIKLFSNFFFHTPHLSGLWGNSKTIYQQPGLGPPNQPFLESFGLPVWLEKKFWTN